MDSGNSHSNADPSSQTVRATDAEKIASLTLVNLRMNRVLGSRQKASVTATALLVACNAGLVLFPNSSLAWRASAVVIVITFITFAAYLWLLDRKAEELHHASGVKQ